MHGGVISLLPCLRLAGLGLRQVVDGDAVRAGHVLAQHPLHVGGGDRLQRGEIGVDARRIAVDQRRLAEREAEALRGLALLELAGQQLRLDLVELAGRDRLRRQPRDLRAQQLSRASAGAWPLARIA